MKPKLKLTSIVMLDEVHRYIQQCNLRDAIGLIQAASDCFDGAFTREELSDLIKNRLLSVVKYTKSERHPDYDDYEELCGHRWTVDLTPKALKHFWPERWNNGEGSFRKRSVPRTSVRSGQVRVRSVRSRRKGRSSHNRKKTVS